MSVAALVVAACGADGRDGETTRSTPPPDRVTVTLQGGGDGSFRVNLDCAVSDRDVCRAVTEAVRRADDDETCTPTDDDGRRILVSGTIEGERFAAVLRRRTDCETRAYDEVLSAVR